MIPVAMMAAGPAGGATRALGMAALRAVPFAAAAGAGGYAAYHVTSALANAGTDGSYPDRAHTKAVIGAYAPLPAMGMAGLGMSAAWRSAHRSLTIVDEMTNLDTNEVVRLGREVPRGWTLGPRMLRGSSVGALVGAAIAAGFAVPVVTTAASLVGRGSEKAVRAAMPDWIEGPATTVPRLETKVVGKVIDAGKYVFAGPPPQHHRFHSEFDVDPAKGFDPARDLGLQAPGGPVTVHTNDIKGVVDDKILDQVQAATGTRPTPVKSRH
jgi:hypothetical protein